MLLLLFHTSPQEILDEDGNPLCLEQEHEGLRGALVKTENPQETQLGFAQMQASKLLFPIALGLLPTNLSWAAVYNERAITVEIIANDILRDNSTAGDPFTVTAATTFALFHIGQFHSGMMVGLTAVSAQGTDYAAVPSEDSWGEGETILYGKIRQLTTLDSNDSFRRARQFGEMLKPPDGFFWDAYENEGDVDLAKVHVDLFKHPTASTIAMIITNRGELATQVNLNLTATEYPDLVGKTVVNDVSSGTASLEFTISGEIIRGVDVPAQTTKGYLIQ